MIGRYDQSRQTHFIAKMNHLISGNPTKPTLVLLPHAGGGGHAFHPMEACLAPFFQIKTIELPGRGARFAEPLLYTAEELANDAWQQIKPLTLRPYAFLGHSMGSLLAYLLCHKIRQMGLRPPEHVFLSGKTGPSIPRKAPHDYLLPRPDFRAKLASYGGINQEILENEDAFDFFEPSIRADFQAVETWRYQPRPKLDVPATVLAGKADDMSQTEVEAWQMEFATKVHFAFFEGGHFFLFDQADACTALLRQRMARHEPAQKASAVAPWGWEEKTPRMDQSLAITN